MIKLTIRKWYKMAVKNELTVNSIKLVVASDASFNTVLDEITKTSNLTGTTLTFTPTSGTEWATSAYYNIIFNVTRTSTSGNGYVTFNNAKFYKQEGGTPTCATPTFSPAADQLHYRKCYHLLYHWWQWSYHFEQCLLLSNFCYHNHNYQGHGGCYGIRQQLCCLCYIYHR